MKAPLNSFQLVQEWALYLKSVLVHHNKGKCKEGFNFQNAVSLQLVTEEGKTSNISLPKDIQ
jgi:hypothetical protein